MEGIQPPAASPHPGAPTRCPAATSSGTRRAGARPCLLSRQRSRGAAGKDACEGTRRGGSPTALRATGSIRWGPRADGCPARIGGSVLYIGAMSSGFVRPCIPTRAPNAAAGADWIHEIKDDGYRLHVQRNGDSVRLFTRRGPRKTARVTFASPGVPSTTTVLRLRLSGEPNVVTNDRRWSDGKRLRTGDV